MSRTAFRASAGLLVSDRIPWRSFDPFLHTINAIESINSQPRRAVKTRDHFPSSEAATKLLWLVLRNIANAWGSAPYDWKAAVNQFAVIDEERFTDPYR